MIPKSISAGINQDGRFEVFAIDGAGVAYHKWQVFPDFQWTDWVSLEGTDLRACAVETDALERLQLVVLGGNGALYIKGQSVANGNWTDWEGLGGSQLSQPVLGKLQDGSLQVFDVGGNTIFGPRFVYNKGQVGPDGLWSDRRQLGANLQLIGLTLGNNADGRLELFALDGNGAAYHKWETGGGWSDWSPLGGAAISQLAVGKNQDGRLELFAIGGDRAVYHMWQVEPNGNWSGWDGGLGRPYLGSSVAQLAAANSRSPDLSAIWLFAIDNVGAVSRIKQALANNGWQEGWHPVLPSHFIQLAAVSQLEGKLGVFALCDDGSIYWTTSGGWAKLP